MKKTDLPKIKKCSCGKELTIEEVQFIGYSPGIPKAKDPKFRKDMPLFNCKYCRSTIVIWDIKPTI